MARSKRRRKRPKVDYVDAELNVMPFIDVFSMLNTFLLFSAVFLSIGIIEVQIPYLSNAKSDDKSNERSLAVKVDMQKNEIEVVTSYSSPPVDEITKKFSNNPQGVAAMHSYLVGVRKKHEDVNKVTLFSDDEVTFDQIAQAVDAIKVRKEGDPEFFYLDKKSGDRKRSSFVYAHVVMGSVML